MKLLNLLKRLLDRTPTIPPGLTNGGIYEVKGYGKFIARPLEHSPGWVLNTQKIHKDEVEKTVLVIMRFGQRIMQVDEKGMPSILTLLTLNDIKLVAPPKP
jgi:hypothetical protein